MNNDYPKNTLIFYEYLNLLSSILLVYQYTLIINYTKMTIYQYKYHIIYLSYIK